MQNHGFYQSMTPQFRSRLRRSYERLSREDRERAVDAYERHLKACRKAGCLPELMFLFEAIEELAAGRKLEAEDVTKQI